MNENKNTFEQTFKPLLTNDELKKMERYKMQLGDNWKDYYYSLSVQDVEMLAKNCRPLIKYDGVQKQQERMKEIAEQERKKNSVYFDRFGRPINLKDINK